MAWNGQTHLKHLAARLLKCVCPFWDIMHLKVNHKREVSSPDFASNTKGALSGLRQFLATERSLKMVKNDFYFTLKALLILEIKFLFWIFGHVGKRLNKKAEANFKIYDKQLQYRYRQTSREVKAVKQWNLAS